MAHDDIDYPVVLVHGMYHGGWCWRLVAQILRESGMTVYAPTLTGLGERSHLLNNEVDFSTHVQDVLNVLEWENLENVILVGHSYGGAVVHAVASESPERLHHVVYLDGGHFNDAYDIEPERRSSVLADPVPTGKSATLCFAVPTGETLWGVRDAEDLKWMRPLLTPHPARLITEPRPSTGPWLHELPRTFVACLLDNDGAPREPMLKWQEVRDDPTITYLELDEPHDVMVTAPKKVTDILISLREN